MTLTQMLLVAGGVFIAWPLVARVLALPRQQRPASFDTLKATMMRASEPPVIATAPQTFESALTALAAVRRRLHDTKMLDEQSRAAIDRITQSLVNGSTNE